MKRFLTAALLLGLAFAAVPSRAEDEKDADKDAQSEFETKRAEKIAAIKEKMKYFQSHVGEWVGTEEYEITGAPDKSRTKDEWKGFFSLDDTHFEMHGKGEGDDGPTTYKWMCTYDPEEEVYRAWYFDSKGNTDTFEMEWDKEQKTLVWTSMDDSDGRTSTFTMKVDGNEITGKGETTDEDGNELIKHTMTYKKKRVQI